MSTESLIDWLFSFQTNLTAEMQVDQPCTAQPSDPLFAAKRAHRAREVAACKKKKKEEKMDFGLI